MGYIYKITNQINGKIYIGQTRTSLTERMRKHFSDARNEPNVTGIDAAIKKYGAENFTAEQICECQDIELDDLERYYISKYNTYDSPNGYNLTPGGQDGTSALNLDENEVIAIYHQLKQINLTAKYFHCCDAVISRILHKHEIAIYRPGRVENILGKGHQFKEGEGTKPVRIISLNKEFSSMKECAQWLIDNGYSKASSMEMARKSLSRCLTGERKTYCKLQFEYI